MVARKVDKRVHLTACSMVVLRVDKKDDTTEYW